MTSLWQPAPEDQNYLVEQAQITFEQTIQGPIYSINEIRRLRLAQPFEHGSAC